MTFIEGHRWYRRATPCVVLLWIRWRRVRWIYRRWLRKVHLKMGSRVGSTLIISFMVQKPCIGGIMPIWIKLAILKEISKVRSISGRGGRSSTQRLVSSTRRTRRPSTTPPRAMPGRATSWLPWPHSANSPKGWKMYSWPKLTTKLASMRSLYRSEASHGWSKLMTRCCSIWSSTRIRIHDFEARPSWSLRSPQSRGWCGVRFWRKLGLRWREAIRMLTQAWSKMESERWQEHLCSSTAPVP